MPASASVLALVPPVARAQPAPPQAAADDPTLLPGRENHAILSAPGMAGLEQLAVGSINGRKTQGGTTAVLLLGSDTSSNHTLPWDIVEGRVADLAAPSAVAVDNTYFEELGTKGIGSFTTLPYVFTTLANTRALREAAPDRTPSASVRVLPGRDIAEVHTVLAARLPHAEVVILGMILSLIVLGLSRDTTVLIVMTPGLAAMLLVLTVGMCACAAVCAIFKVTRIDPAVVFSR
jgi:hypothetical protein